MRTFVLSATASVALLLSGCGYKLGYRHFPGPIVPVAETQQTEEFNVGDDRSITFAKGRLESACNP